MSELASESVSTARPRGTGKVGVGTPSRLRSFDPVRLASLEYRVWVGYYLRQWPRVLAAAVGLVRAGFGMNWYRTLYGSWLVLRANQLWAPYPDNDAKGAQACMRRFYSLITRAYGEPADPAKAAELEVEWWRVHREGQHRENSHAVDDTAPAQANTAPAEGNTEPAEELVESLTRLYCYLYHEPAKALRPAAVHRAQAMGLSDEWVRQGCQPDSSLLPLERAALVRCYAVLLAAVHH